MILIRWERILYAIRDYIFLFVLVAFSFVMIMNNNRPQVNWMRANVLGWIGTWQGWMSSIYQYRALKAENEILRDRLALFSYENGLLKEAYLENDRLRKMLDFRQQSEFKLATVSIIRRSYQGFSHALHINVGSQNGVKTNMPVVASEGLVGKIVIVSRNSSVVQVYDDVNFRVSTIVQRSRVTGILSPGENQTLQLEYVPIHADVKEGDVIVTSGYSEFYPKGIEIGTISKIESEVAGLFRIIYVTPSVDLLKLEDAFVILNRPTEIQ